MCTFLGTPHLDYFKAMEHEHCGKQDSMQSFTTSNYGLVTCPSQEYKIVLQCDLVWEDMHRRIPNYKKIFQKDESRRAHLTEEEIVAIILYTGPMVFIVALSF